MSEKCELLDNCGFFNNYKGNSEVVKNGWIRMFCKSRKINKLRQKKNQDGNRPASGLQHDPYWQAPLILYYMTT